MTTLQLVAASTFDDAALAELFNAGYTGYEFPTHMNAAAFATMRKFVDIDVSRSVVALEGGRPAAFAMLALRGHEAWIGGMGVAPEFRGRGLGTEVMRAAIANARAAGAHAVDLEVLVGNAHAIRIYEALGFMPVGRLVVWLVEPATPVAAPPAPAPKPVLPLVTLDHAAALELIDEWVVEPAPWQRAHASIAHLPEPPSALGFMHDGAVAGAVVYRGAPERASILALGAHGNGQRAMLDALVDAVLARHPGAPLRFLNLPEGDPAEPVFERLGARVEARQVHMRLAL